MGKVEDLLFRYGPGRFRAAVVRNLGLPQGALGRRIGRNLVDANDGVNRLAVELLAPMDGEVVLEFGHGPGSGIGMVLAAAPGATVVGLDPSSDMVAAAGRRNAAAVADGRLRLHEGACERIPLDTDSVDAAFGNNVVYFWRDPAVALAELRRVIRPGGRVLLGYRPRSTAPDLIRELFERAGNQLYEVDQVEAMLLAAGFLAASTKVGETGEAVTMAFARQPHDRLPDDDEEPSGPVFVVD